MYVINTVITAIDDTGLARVVIKEGGTTLGTASASYITLPLDQLGGAIHAVDNFISTTRSGGHIYVPNPWNLLLGSLFIDAYDSALLNTPGPGTIYNLAYGSRPATATRIGESGWTTQKSHSSSPWVMGTDRYNYSFSWGATEVSVTVTLFWQRDVYWE